MEIALIAMTEANPYSQPELERLQAHYRTLKDKASYDAFIHYGHHLLKRIGADSYHVRMALTKGDSMMEFGSRAVYQHHEKSEGIEIGLLIRAADINMVAEQYRRVEHTFKPVGGMVFIHPVAADWSAFPKELLALHEIAMREEYARIKDTALVEIRKASATTNAALKHALIYGVLPNEFPSPLGLIMVNITWNSIDWKGPSQDKSSHGYVKEGNIAQESWNFDLDNERNTVDKVYGFWQHVGTPKLKGRNNLVIFHSANEIVGFYGLSLIHI